MALPPEAMRLWKVPKHGYIETPLDRLGRVDLDTVILTGKATIDPEYDWQATFNDIHHLQHPSAQYRSSETLRQFKELKGRKVWLPRTFHDWVHFIMDDPPKPSIEVMKESINAETIAIELTMIAGRALILSQDPAGKPQRMEALFELYCQQVERASRVPIEFQLLSPRSNRSARQYPYARATGTTR